MSSNNYRFLTSCRNNPELSKLITCIDKKFPEYTLGSNMPVPNQALKSATLKSGQPVKLCINKQAGITLDMIRSLAQEKSDYRLSNNQKDTPIEFVCLGYMSNSGNLVIDKIICPAIDYVSQNSKDIDEAKKNLFKYVPKKDVNIDTLCTYFDYMRETNLQAIGKSGRMPVAFLGTTKPMAEYTDHTENCPRLGEIAKSIVPGDVDFKNPFMSGLICVTPYVIKQTPKGKVYSDGSIECIATSYIKNEKNNSVKPSDFFNLTYCERITPNDQIETVPISCSYQPLQGLPQLSSSYQKQ